MANEYVINAVDAVGVADVIREKAEISQQLVWPEGWKAAIRGISGLHPILIVTAPSGSTITAVNGDDTVTGVVGAEGALTLDLPAFGTWAVTGRLNEQEASTSVYIEQEYPVLLSYITTFTVNGGHGETVTVKEGDTTLATVTLNSAGTGTVALDNVSGKTLVFIGGISGYKKSVSVGGGAQETVNVYPDGALYWYGRVFTEVTGGWSSAADGVFKANGYVFSQSPITFEQNCMKFGAKVNTYVGFAITKNEFDFTGYNTIRIGYTYTQSHSEHGRSGFVIFESSVTDLWNTANRKATKSMTTTSSRVEEAFNIQNVSGKGRFAAIADMGGTVRIYSVCIE